MGSIGFPEMVMIMVIVLLVFGPKKLPDFAKSMGQAVREFRRASQEMVDEFERASSTPPPSPKPVSEVHPVEITTHEDAPAEAPHESAHPVETAAEAQAAGKHAS